ncbi:uncharacterized protein LOC118423232 [Branchiostoma floridae]|uniref:Uncharacterized protein LOC118423232 n=1 Tax=Branchiostoma floridae TaxID=7739 RepID=A0A9J7LS07_BRAFL|nr:uncharacterized protein LOC118423232 [Branchiostoma floridae]
MSDVECPSKNSDRKKNEENLNIKEEPYDPDFDGPNHCAQNTSFVVGQRTETTLGKRSLRDDPNRTSNTNNTGTTEAECERSASSTFPLLPKVKSEPGSESEKCEIVCAKPKEEPNNVILSCALLYSAVHRNTDSGAGPCRDGVQMIQKTMEDNKDPPLCKAIKCHDDGNEDGKTEIPSFGGEGQDEEQAPFKRWTVTSSHLVPVRETKSHTTQTSLVQKNLDIGAQSSPKDEDEEDVNLSLLEAGSGTSCDLHMSLGQVKRGHQESAVGANKRQKQGNVTTPGNTVVKQECEEKDNAEISKVASNNETAMMCDLCSSTFASKILLENHQCREVVYFCKICSLESNRPCPPVLMPLSEAEEHFYLHFHPWLASEKIESAVTSTTKIGTQIFPSKFGTRKYTRPGSQISFNFQCRLPEELQGKTLKINREEVDLLKGIYIGTFLSEVDGRYHCGLCDANFSTMNGRAGHVSKVHLENKTRNCGGTGCEKISYSTFHQAKLFRHMFAAHCDLVMAPSPYLKCKFCAMQFCDRTDLEWHFYHHMQPTVSFRTDAGKPKPGWPRKDLKSKYASGSKAQFKCTMCTFESIQSSKVQLYTAAEARDHLAWHWLTQLPPEIRKSPNILNFEISSDSIQRLYMIPHAPKANITCEFCGQTFTASSTHTHMSHWHRDYIRKPHRCMSPECKHLQFITKQSFFGHMFSQHVSVIKRETFVFLCQICGKTFENRSKVEWHCYVHRVRPAVSSRKGNAK